MKLVELRTIFEHELHSIYEVDEVRQHFAALCELYFKYSSAEVVLRLQESISEADSKRFRNDLDRLKKNVPIQYIVGNIAFAGVQLHVNHKVLIPRPETEELVHFILTTLTKNDSLRVLDICTGSGCIALALKKARPNWRISAWDFDEDALCVAQQNANDNKLLVDFQKWDVFSKNLPKKKWDIIVSNPPYVPEVLKKTTQPHVIEHEPLHAIFVPDENPLYFYERISQYAVQQLTQQGNLFFEGHASFMESVKNILQHAGFSDIVLRNDFRANPRFIHACKP